MKTKNVSAFISSSCLLFYNSWHRKINYAKKETEDFSILPPENQSGTFIMP